MRQLLAAMVVATVCAVPAHADEAARGGPLFRQHCATCHGIGARGDGPMAAILTVDVPDLTRLAVRNGGDFPTLQVIAAIDGRSQLRGHGGPMPVFGFALGGGSVALDFPDGSVMETSADILALARWLNSVQQ
ncbi:c-type cytochrome [Actibacterium sp. D379-3]